MEYAKLPGLTPDGTMYWNEEMGTVEAVLPPGGYKTAHGPGLLELENGDMLCVWFAGSFEGNADVNVICARLKKGADRWEEPVLVSHDPERSEQNPSLFAGPDGKVWAMYTSQLSRVEGKDNMQFTSVIRCQKSADGGRDLERLRDRIPGGGKLLPSAHPGALQWTLDLRKLDLHGLRAGAHRRSHRLPHLRRPG